MITKSLAILLAVVGLMVCAVEASAQPRMGGFRARGGFAAPRWGGGFGPRAAGRGFGGAPFGARVFGAAPYRATGGYGAAPPYGPMGGGFGVRRGGYGGYGGYPPAYGGAPSGFDGGWRNQQNAVRQAVREGRQVPLSQAIEAVRRRAPGRELDAGLEQGPGGRPVYRLRWAGQDGRRQDYLVDAGSGAVLGVQGPQAPIQGAPWGGPP